MRWLLAGSMLSACSLAWPAERFYSAWSAAQNMAVKTPALSDATVRMIVRPTIGGSAVRIQIGNTVAHAPVEFSAAYLGRAGQGASIVAGSNRALTFAGKPGLTLAPGAEAYSDPVFLRVEAFERLAISLDVVTATEISTHALGLVTNYHAPGRRAQAVSGQGFIAVPPLSQGVKAFPFYWVANVDVASGETAGTIVALGDSITDGRCSTTTHGEVVPDRYQRWTDILAERLATQPATYAKAVSNAGISGNRLLQATLTGPSASERLERDVLAKAGVTHVILFIGTNDIFRGATAGEVIEGAEKIIERVHARGIKIIGATMIPRGRPAGVPGNGFTALQEEYRLALNAWIRERASFDGVIDFDAILRGGGRSPTGAAIMRADYVCDYSHPNSAGYRAMGDAIDLELFK